MTGRIRDHLVAEFGQDAVFTDVDNIPGMFDKKRPITATTREVIQFIEKRDDLRAFLKTLKKAATSIKKENVIFEIASGASLRTYSVRPLRLS